MLMYNTIYTIKNTRLHIHTSTYSYILEKFTYIHVYTRVLDNFTYMYAYTHVLDNFTYMYVYTRLYICL